MSVHVQIVIKQAWERKDTKQPTQCYTVCVRHLKFRSFLMQFHEVQPF